MQHKLFSMCDAVVLGLLFLMLKRLCAVGTLFFANAFALQQNLVN